jgi:hypothetical protein
MCLFTRAAVAFIAYVDLCHVLLVGGKGIHWYVMVHVAACTVDHGIVGACEGTASCNSTAFTLDSNTMYSLDALPVWFTSALLDSPTVSHRLSISKSLPRSLPLLLVPRADCEEVMDVAAVTSGCYSNRIVEVTDMAMRYVQQSFPEFTWTNSALVLWHSLKIP